MYETLLKKHSEHCNNNFLHNNYYRNYNNIIVYTQIVHMSLNVHKHIINIHAT